MLARAFFDDPLFGYFVPEPRCTQTKALLAFMNARRQGRARRSARCWVAHTDGKVACAAVWLPPGSYPRGLRRDLLTNVRAAADLLRTAASGSARAFALLAAVDKAHHEVHEPHYYLAMLGTDPLFQRSGAGSAVLAPVLERCDAEGLPAYLETQKEANIAYYARHRFELVQKIDMRRCPPIWTLLRDPADQSNWRDCGRV